MTTGLEEVGARNGNCHSGKYLRVQAFLARIPAHDPCTRSEWTCAGIVCGCVCRPLGSCEWDDLLHSELIQKVGPILHERDPLFQVRSPVIRSSHFILVLMR